MRVKNLSQFKRLKLNLSLALILGVGLCLTACSNISSVDVSSLQNLTSTNINNSGRLPAAQFDLSHWKLTLPVDDDENGKADSIDVSSLQFYAHPEFFFLDEQGDMVFTAPNKGATTKNSGNTRSELRYLVNGHDRKVKSKDPFNNFVLASHLKANEYAAVGMRMEATLHIDHVPLNSNQPDNKSSYAGVIGQIHGVKLKQPGEGFGYGNEPLKIIYKKWPEHESGSVYWNIERNLSTDNSSRKDISYPVWGKPRTDSADPGEQGVSLGEAFSYVVNVYEDTMYLTFISPRLGTVRHQINLANNIDLHGNIDLKDNPKGYAQDALYFKAGIYNQCRGTAKKNKPIARCQGTGKWETDKANGDYFQVSFSQLNVLASHPEAN